VLHELKVLAIMHFTNREPELTDSFASGANVVGAGAPANEIEITPEMIEAGAMVIYSNEMVDIGRGLRTLPLQL
jgi:hypothetical protein